MQKLSSLAIALIASVCLTQSCIAQQPTFHNPLLPSGPDPWVIADHGFYYYMNSTGQNLTVWKTRDITDLVHAEKKIVWTPPASGPYSHEIWAPEIHRFDNKWYIYFSADAGQNESHRIFVIENATADPLTGEWTFKGQLDTVKWAIDATVFEDRGQKYILWSGWQGDSDGEQRIYIARLRNPWTIDSERGESEKQVCRGFIPAQDQVRRMRALTPRHACLPITLRGYAIASGNDTRNVDPGCNSGFESIVSEPPVRSTISCDTQSPSPVPLSTRVV